MTCRMECVHATSNSGACTSATSVGNSCTAAVDMGIMKTCSSNRGERRPSSSAGSAVDDCMTSVDDCLSSVCSASWIVAGKFVVSASDPSSVCRPSIGRPTIPSVTTASFPPGVKSRTENDGSGPSEATAMKGSDCKHAAWATVATTATVETIDVVVVARDTGRRVVDVEDVSTGVERCDAKVECWASTFLSSREHTNNYSYLFQRLCLVASLYRWSSRYSRLRVLTRAGDSWFESQPQASSTQASVLHGR